MRAQAANHLERWKNHFAALPQLNLKFEDMHERWPSLLVGQLPEKFLIATKPRGNVSDSQIKIGNNVKVIHLFEGSIYGFEATILHHTDSPARLIFLSYPAKIELVELRRHLRLNAQIPAWLLHGDQRHAGVLWDLSLGGCRFMSAASPQGLEADAPVLLSIASLGPGAPLECYGNIRSLSLTDSKLMVGIQFDPLRSGPQLQAIQDYINQVLNVLNET